MPPMILSPQKTYMVHILATNVQFFEVLVKNGDLATLSSEILQPCCLTLLKVSPIDFLSQKTYVVQLVAFHFQYLQTYNKHFLA